MRSSAAATSASHSIVGPPAAAKHRRPPGRGARAVSRKGAGAVGKKWVDFAWGHKCHVVRSVGGYLRGVAKCAERSGVAAGLSLGFAGFRLGFGAGDAQTFWCLDCSPRDQAGQ